MVLIIRKNIFKPIRYFYFLGNFQFTFGHAFNGFVHADFGFTLIFFVQRFGSDLLLFLVTKHGKGEV